MTPPTHEENKDALLAGVSLSTFLQLKGAKPEDVEFTVAGPNDKQLYSGGISTKTGRLLLSSSFFFQTPKGAHDHMVKVFEQIQIHELSKPSSPMEVLDLFFLEGRGTVLTGTTKNQTAFQPGTKIRIQTPINTALYTQIIDVEVFRNLVSPTETGSPIGILLQENFTKDQVPPGSLVFPLTPSKND
jgi:hypothetical protein